MSSQHKSPRFDASIEMGMTEPLLRRGSELPLRQSRSSSFRQNLIKLLDNEPAHQEERLQRTSTCGAIGYLGPAVWGSSDGCSRCILFFSFLLILLVLILFVLAPIALKFAVDGLVIEFGKLPQPVTSRAIMLVVQRSWDNDEAPTFWVCIFLLIRLVAAMLGECRDYCFQKALLRGQTTLSQRLMTHLQGLSLTSLNDMDPKKLKKIFSAGSRSFVIVGQTFLCKLLPIFFSLIFIIIVFLLLLPWYYAVAFVGVLIVYFICSGLLYILRSNKLQAKSEEQASLNAKSNDALTHNESIKFFNAETHEIARHASALLSYCQAAGSYYLWNGVANFLQTLLLLGGLLLLLILSCYDIYDGVLEVGDFVMILAYVLYSYPMLLLVGPFVREMRQARRNADKYLQVLKQGRRAGEPMMATAPHFRNGNLEFRNVSFTYAPAIEKPRLILSNVTFEIKSGQRVAVVGPPGSGKSTLLKLIYRFYDISQGAIVLDGMDIRRVKSKDLRQAISVVPQGCALFQDSVQYNIGYGGVATNPEALDDIQVIQQVAQQSKAHQFIVQLDQDYKTKCGGRMKLPALERARVGLARALLKQGAVLFCVDAMGADEHTNDEIEYLTKVKEVVSGTSALIVSWKLAAVKDCDQILVMNKGRIEERGTHEELLKIGGLYRSMWEQQTREAPASEGQGQKHLVA